MKSKILVSAFILIIIAGSWSIVLNKHKSSETRLQQILEEIDSNMEVKTYKNTIKLYDELINLEKDNIEWYQQYAKVYYLMGQYGNYERICNLIISEFPDQVEGYKLLLNLFSEDLDHEEVIAAYNSMPVLLQADKDIIQIYKDSEWTYTYLSKAYDYIDMFSAGYAVVHSDGLYGYTNSYGQEIIESKFNTARPFIEGHAAVFNEDEWYFIDTEGDRVLATKESITDLYSFSEGYAVAMVEGNYGYIDKFFNKYDFSYENATNFYNGISAVQKDGKWALLNRNFELVTDFIFENIIVDTVNLCSRKSVIFAQIEGEYHMIDSRGNDIIPITFEDAKLFYNDIAAVKKNGKWGFVDLLGNIVIDYQYDDANSFNLGIAPIKLNDQWGYINTSNEIVIDYNFEYASTVTNLGVCIIKTGDVYRFIQFNKFK